MHSLYADAACYPPTSTPWAWQSQTRKDRLRQPGPCEHEVEGDRRRNRHRVSTAKHIPHTCNDVQQQYAIITDSQAACRAFAKNALSPQALGLLTPLDTNNPLSASYGHPVMPPSPVTRGHTRLPEQ